MRFRISDFGFRIPALALVCGGIAILGFALDAQPEPKLQTLASFSTSLEGRMNSQRHNAELGLEKLDGQVIEPGETFSFNKIVGTCSRDQGYRKAPVSYNGQLIASWGGGVCQTSTTLYNAALLAGMEIIERNRHRFAPSYVPAGRDAAVAFDSIDLKFRNPNSFPIKLLGKVVHDKLVIDILGEKPLAQRPQIVQDVRQVRAPRLVEFGSRPGKPRLRNSGKAGFEVATYRVIGNRKELLSTDSYPAMHRIVEYRP